jgi:hypothetical protein
MPRRILRLAGELRRSEQGIALPTALFVTIIALTLASVPIMASVNTDRSDSRDQASDSALAAADTGASMAVSRQTQMAKLVSTSKPCVKLNGTKLEAVAVEASGWCPAVPATSIGNSTYSYQVKPAYTSSGATISVLATGTTTTGVRTVTRRLLVNASSTGGASRVVFGTDSVVGIDSVTMTNGTVYGNVGSNGNVEWPSGDAHIQNCTGIRVGNPSGAFNKQSWQVYPSCPIVKENREYPPPIVPSTTSNSRMFTAGGDTYTYSNGAMAGCGAASWQASWCPTSRVLHLTSDARVTLSGTAPYVFCQLLMDNDAHIIMPAGSHVQIIFDSPENCGLASGTTQFSLQNGASLISPAYSPSTGNYSVPGLYFVGSTKLATKIYMDGGTSANNMIIYAPRSNIEIKAGASFGGAILGKTVYMDGGTKVMTEGTGFNPDEGLPIEGTGGSSTFSRGAYVECSAKPTVETEPASGC